jgi:hypothetical protein
MPVVDLTSMRWGRVDVRARQGLRGWGDPGHGVHAHMMHDAEDTSQDPCLPWTRRCGGSPWRAPWHSVLGAHAAPIFTARSAQDGTAAALLEDGRNAGSEKLEDISMKERCTTATRTRTRRRRARLKLKWLFPRYEQSGCPA